jgi:hypothetical protein
MDAKPAQGGQRQHRRAPLWVSSDQQIPTVVLVAQRKLGQADNDVPVMRASVLSQPRHRGLDVFAIIRERRADNVNVPGVVIVARRWAQVAQPPGDVSGCRRVGDQADVNGRHLRTLPALGPFGWQGTAR